MKHLTTIISLIIGLSGLNALAANLSAAEQRILDLETPATGIESFHFYGVDQNRFNKYDLSSDEIGSVIAKMERVLRSQIATGALKLVNGDSNTSSGTGSSFQYDMQDIHLVSGQSPQRIVLMQSSEGMYRSNKQVLTGPFYMETANQYCRVFKNQIKNFSTFSLIYPPLWFPSGSSNIIVDCIEKSSQSDQQMKKYFFSYSDRTPNLTETNSYP